MPRKRSPARVLGTQLIDLGAAAPSVVSQRLLQMATAGATPSARDRREFTRMSSEKVSAAWESWGAMAGYAMRLNTAATQTALAFWMPWAFAAKPLPSAEDALISMATAGVQPYRRIAVANHRRLSKRAPRR
ncbi:hypothetical protein MMG85_17415 [Pseudoxanthomonas sp. LH2527]|uniref:hypothetical protein n=1 Tax=Pseudoxanthomonas sp. LH2527 TaxID=2923249 RepID=UPI001F12A58F|nr:hypothetical protein [Pseudoxanthomonas sp. LH2527]MCH6485334.1 hypothetical protein [Pseudoxanthomonas sp. LH2527]